MPYKLKGNCVVKADSGETVKCHDTREKALAHLRALEANVADAKSVLSIFELARIDALAEKVKNGTIHLALDNAKAAHDYHTEKMQRCIGHLEDQGFEPGSAHAICYATLEAAGEEPNKSFPYKIGARNNAGDAKRIQGIHDASAELGAMCGTDEAKSFPAIKMMKMMEMGAADYAIHEGWDIQQCCSVISQISAMCQDECNEGEMDEAMQLCQIMMQLMDYCKGECQEMMDSMQQVGTETTSYRSFAIPINHKELNLSYVKSIGVGSTKSMAVKFTARNEIKGYTFLWGSPKLTDVEVEYFTQATNFWDERLGKSARPLTWDHAQDNEFKASPVIGSITDFGDDEIGRWYVAKLDTAHQYRKAIDELIKKGVLGTSSDSAPQYVIREKTGKSTWLKEWPWFASALTNTPAEPRMIGSLEFLKSLGVVLPDVAEIQSRFEHKKRQAEVLKLKYHIIK